MSGLVDDFLGNENTTGRLPVGTAVQGKLQRSMEEDWFKVDLQAGVTYYLHFTSQVSSYFKAYAIGFFDPALGAIADATIMAREDELYLEFTPLTSGVYYALAVNLTDTYDVVPYSLQLDVRTQPDDIPAGTAADLIENTSGSGVFEQAGDVDWFRFHAEQGYHYSILYANPAIASLTVFDGEGQVVSDNGFAFDPLYTGDYYISVASDSAAPYTFSTQRWHDDFAQHPDTAGRLDGMRPVQGSLDYEFDQDWLRVDVEQDKFYAFALDSTHDMVFGLTLYDQNGNRIHYDYSFISAGGPHLSYRAPASGAVYLQIDRAASGSVINYALPYEVSMSVASDDVADDPARAALLAIGTAAQGSLQMASDRDTFRISAEAGITYRIVLASDGGGAYLKLDLAHAGAATPFDSKVVGQAGSLEFTAAVSGEYVVAVGSDGWVRQNTAYTLTTERAVDDWAANQHGAGQAVVDAAVSGRLENTADRDWYAVKLDAGTTYWFDATAGGAHAYGASMRILGADGQALLSHDVPVRPAPMSFTPQASGLYYIEIASRGDLTGSYAIATTVGPRDDVGSTVAQARPLPVGAAFSGQIEVGSDQDVFRLDVVAGQTYVLSLNASAFSSTTVELTDASGNPLTRTPGTANKQDLAAFVPEVSGSVYATVRAPGASSYEVKVTSHRDDHADAPTPAATSLTEGSSVTGILEHRADLDVLHMALDAHRTYVATIKGDAGNPPPILSFLREGQGYVSILEQWVANGERTVKFTTGLAGDYFLELKSANQSGTGYTLTALPFAGDGNGPSLVGQSHSDQGVDVSMLERTISLRFSENIVVDRNAIVLRDSAGKAVLTAIGSGVTVTGDTLTVKLANFLTPDTYTLSLPSAAIHDAAGNRYAGPQTLTFSTARPADQPAPGNDVYRFEPGAYIDGGAGVDTLSVGGFRMFSFVSPVLDGYVVEYDGKTVHIRNVERLLFLDQIYALDVDGVAGQAYRLYQASFDRVPDLGGLGFWIQKMDGGISLRTVADAFVSSPEFAQLYGASLSDAVFAETLYENVLHRAPDAAGLDFWVKALERGVDRADILIHFSESVENQEALAEVIGSGFYYQTNGGGF